MKYDNTKSLILNLWGMTLVLTLPHPLNFYLAIMCVTHASFKIFWEKRKYDKSSRMSKSN